MKLIGISGQARSGKDTAADFIISELGYTKISLADPIKRYCRSVFAFSETQLWGPSEHRNAPDPRFTSYTSLHEGCDAWMAVFRRAESANKEFVKEVFPDSPLLQGDGLASLNQTLQSLAENHTNISPRVALQMIGTEWARSLKSDVWTKYLLRTASTLLAGGYEYDSVFGLVEKPEHQAEGVVVSDVRFGNELQEIKNHNGFLIRIYREETDSLATDTGIKDHASEKEQQEFDDDFFNFVISNDSSLEQLTRSLEVIRDVINSRG